MKARDQFYSQMHEAMHENGLTTGVIAAEFGSHYTYIYNTMRQQTNVTLDTASRLATAAGYEMTITLKPLDASIRKALNGDMAPDTVVYTSRAKPGEGRRGKKKDAPERGVTQPFVDAAATGDAIECRRSSLDDELIEVEQLAQVESLA